MIQTSDYYTNEIVPALYADTHHTLNNNQINEMRPIQTVKMLIATFTSKKSNLLN